MTAEEATLLHDKIANAQHIVIVGHSRPDGDAIGSCLSWATYLSEEFGKEAAVVVPNAFPDFLHWLPGRETIVRYDKHPEEVKRLFAESDLVFCCDFNLYSRVDDMEEVLKNAKGEFVMIDHHLGYDIDTVVRASFPDLSSTCEIVFRIVWQMGGFDKLSKKFAICDYCGMMTDTGGFTFASTRPEIFFIICQLLTKGIDKDKIYRNVFNNYSYNRMRLLGFVLYRRLKYIPEKGVAYFILNRGDLLGFHFIKGDLEGVVNMPLQIKGTRLSMSFREDSEKKDTVWVSLRSVDDFSCTEFAQRHFNGGGHRNASGGRLYCKIHEVEPIVLKAISELPDISTD